MTWLPRGTRLGDLELTETLVYYDGPRVFTCNSLTDQLYLVAWADESPANSTWLYVPISAARYRMVRSGGLPLRVAFEHPEHKLYEVRIPYDGAQADEVREIDPSGLQDEWLPETDFSLDLPTQTLVPALPDDQLERLSRQESRGRVRIFCTLPRYARSEAPTKRVGELLISTQSVYDNIGLAMLSDEPAAFGPIPAEVAQETATDVIGLSAASFVIEIASNAGDDLFGDSTFSRITARLLDLLDVSLAREPLFTQLSELRPRGAKSFRNFVKGLASTGGDIRIDGASAALGHVARALSNEQLQILSNLLHSLVPDDIYEIRGRMRLYRADMERKQFGLRDLLTEEAFEGQIAQSALVQVDHAELNDVFDVVVNEFRTFDEAVGERRPLYVLQQLISTSGEPIPMQVTEVNETP